MSRWCVAGLIWAYHSMGLWVYDSMWFWKYELVRSPQFHSSCVPAYPSPVVFTVVSFGLPVGLTTTAALPQDPGTKRSLIRTNLVS